MDIFANCLFNIMSFGHIVILTNCCLDKLSSRQIVISANRHLDKLPSRQIAISTKCHLGKLSSRQIVFSTNFHIDALSSCQIVISTNCQAPITIFIFRRRQFIFKLCCSGTKNIFWGLAFFLLSKNGLKNHKRWSIPAESKPTPKNINFDGWWRNSFFIAQVTIFSPFSPPA